MERERSKDKGRTVSLPLLTLDSFKEAAQKFIAQLVDTPLPNLYRVTDGKAIGTQIEVMFKAYLQGRYEVNVGNAASGLDFPSLNLDLKVTSVCKPQSSSPFRDATQKIYGLGYNLLIIVYKKRDVDEEKVAYLGIENLIYIDKERTGDFTLTKSIREIIDNIDNDTGGKEAAVDDIDALLQDRNIPLDALSRRQLAERLISDKPKQGVLTISNALQWRLQYKRAISIARGNNSSPEIEELRLVQ